MDGKQLTGTVAGWIAKLVIGIIVIMVIYKLTVSAYDFGYRIFGEEPVSTEETTISVTVLEGKSVMQIGEMLEEKGLIRSAKLFYVQEKVSSYHGDIKPGIYELSPSMTPEEMMAVMSTTLESGSEDGVVTDSVSDNGTVTDTVSEDGAVTDGTVTDTVSENEDE